MEKSDLMNTPALKAPEVTIMPRTLIRRPMEYKHPAGVSLFFHGVFGNDADSKQAGDVWVATFYAEHEAEAAIMAFKTMGEPINGVRLGLVKEEESGVARISSCAPSKIVSPS